MACSCVELQPLIPGMTGKTDTILIGQVHDSTNNANYACYNVYKTSNWTATSLTSQGYWWCSTAINFNDWNP